MATQAKKLAKGYDTEAATSLPAEYAQELVNGPAAAALFAAGIGSAFYGITVVLTEAVPAIKTAMAFVKPVGPLSGKTTVGMIGWLIAWAILYFLYRGKNVDMDRIATLSLILLAIGLVFTFPPFYDLFH